MKWPDDAEAIHAAYQTDGFVVVKSLFETTCVNDILKNLQRYIADVTPHIPPMDVFYDDVSSQRDIRMLSRMNRHDGYFQSLLTSKRLVNLAEMIWGHPVVPLDAALFNKPSVIGDATPPHQDGYYFHLRPCEATTYWLALDDIDEGNGCLKYVTGSHRRGMRPHGRTKVLGFSQGIIDYGPDDSSREVAICVTPGDVIVHDALTIHRADPNQSARNRRALGFVYFSGRAHVDTAARDEYQRQLTHDLSVDGKI